MSDTPSTSRARVIRVTVRGLPAPQGSKRHVGKGVMVESSKKVAPWRQDVRAAAEEVMRSLGAAPLDEPVILRVVFTMPAPTSLPKRRPSYPSKMPDLSKLVRSTEDALTSAGVWKDDARVVMCGATKTYPRGTLGADPMALDCPGAVIEIVPVTAEAA